MEGNRKQLKYLPRPARFPPAPLAEARYRTETSELESNHAVARRENPFLWLVICVKYQRVGGEDLYFPEHTQSNCL